jgi:O-antigen/teichoic acid export membrane protein
MRIASSVLWNVFGTVLPLLAALVSVPPLIAELGTVRFGILAVTWVLVGYFSFFDMGLGRALTQLIAQKVGQGAAADVPSIVWSGMKAMVLLGLAGGAVVAAISPWVVRSKLSIPHELQEETLHAFYILAASVPLVIIGAGLRGILEGLQRFDMVNIVRGPVGALAYLGPLASLHYSNTLPPVVATLLAGRLIFCVAYGWMCVRSHPELMRRPGRGISHMQRLLAFGGWMTLSNIAGPLLLHLGRLALATMVSAEAVAYFSTPYDVIINLLLIPGIAVTVLFPAFTDKFQRDRSTVRGFYHEWLRIVGFVMLPLALASVLLAKPGLAFWIDAEFSERSYRVAQILAVGIFINSFGYISQALIQAYGRPDLTAKLHVAELVAYVPYLIWLVEHFAIEGAAVAWCVRVTISTIALALIANACLAGTIAAQNRETTQRAY